MIRLLRLLLLGLALQANAQAAMPVPGALAMVILPAR